MKFTKCLLFSKFLIAAFAANTNIEGLTDEELNHATAHGIFRSILLHRDFGSHMVKFSEWESPAGDVYVVPSTDVEDESNPALGLGYKFINSDSSVVQSSDIRDVATIKEENISAAGFPKLWKKKHEDEEQTADDFFPFGSKKFMMIGLNKQSVDTDTEGSDSVENAGLFKWFAEEEDDCNADKKTNKLFDTDHFMFVGVGSVDIDNTGQAVEKREEITSMKYITSFTTTTITSTHEITITETEQPHTHFGDDHHKEKKVSSPDTTEWDDDDEDDYEPTTEFHEHYETETPVTTTHEPFVFSTTTEEYLPIDSLPTQTAHSTWEAPNEDHKEVTETLTTTVHPSKTIVSEPTLSETTSELSLTVDVNPTLTEEESKVWTVPTTWESYPFSSVKPETTTTHLHYSNTTEMISSFEQFKTSSFYGNKTSKSTKMKNDSIYTRTNDGNHSNITTSKNVGNNIQGSYMGSVFGLVFAVISGVILI